MNKKICFITDSASDMGTLKLDHVKVLPMEVAFGQEIYKAAVSFNNTQLTPAIHNLGYNVKINVDNYRGNKSYYHTHGVALYDNVLRTYHKINSSYISNNNAIIKRLTNSYKNDMEHILKAKTRVK